MDRSALIESCLRYPVSVAVAVIFVIFFGFLSAVKIPIQLTPDISRPVVTVETIWPGSSPAEVEREIIERQEEFLNSLEGLVELKSQALPNRAEITLEFIPGTNIDTALLRVNNQLGRVPGYPPEAERPVLRTSGERENAIAWFVLTPRNTNEQLYVPHLKEFVEDEIESRLERIEGVAAANIFGGQDREVRITFSPAALASRQLTIPEVLKAINRTGKDISGGKIDEGKRRYLVRTIGAFEDISQMAGIVVREDLRDRVLLSDIAKVEIMHEEPMAQVRVKGIPCIAMNIQRRVGSNLLDIMDELKVVVEELNSEVLNKRGLELQQVYDSSIYVRGALKGVTQNLFIGALLAIIVLLLILRSGRPTLIISMAIPISAIGTFVGMFVLGRTLNVVSMAGLTFAVGMLVDNSIVVLEAIFRRIQEGESAVSASIQGTREVWGAILASTLTTVVVFVPLLFMNAEVAQLFQDIAIAISCAVVLSLFVSVLVIPTLCARLLNFKIGAKDAEDTKAIKIVDAVEEICRRKFLRYFVIVFMTTASLFLAWNMAPSAEYLPAGSRNLVFSILIPPPGFNLDEMVRIGKGLEGELEELWTGENAPIKNFFFVAMDTRMFMGFRARETDQVEDLIGKVRAKLSKVPGMIAIVVRAGLFGNALSGGRSIEVLVQGPDLSQLMARARKVFFALMEKLPNAQVRPDPGLDLGQPELQLKPRIRPLSEAGWSSADLGLMVDSLVDGVRAGEFRMSDGKIVDVILRSDQLSLQHTQDLENLPIFVPGKGVTPLGGLADVSLQMGPTAIQRSETIRSITLIVSLPAELSLESAMKTIEKDVMASFESDFRAPYSWKMAGTADKLTTTRRELQGLFLTAILVIYLLMASLFQSFIYPLIILFTVPLATFGGILGLRFVDRFVAAQTMDVLTMLGFIILLGTVVNNAILLVDKTLQLVREGELAPWQAVSHAVSLRIRPILMSTLTSLMGLTPLVLMVGPGSELYRGIGAVILGGLLVATVFTLVLIPALLTTILEWRRS